MSKDISNPFGITKATEFSYDEIYEYWVDFDAENSVEYLLNTSEILPKYILGSRGCGKTHLLRYFSLKTRLMKFDNKSEDLISSDKFIGFYNTFGVLNSGNFNGSFLEEEQWLQVFKIYFEYYLCEIFIYDLLTILDNMEDAKVSWHADVCRIFEEALNISSSAYKENTSGLSAILDYFQTNRTKIDKEIILAAFTRKFDFLKIEFKFTPGDFIKNIISKISSSIEFFKDVKFIFILDEYDKLLEWQKIYINTLVWDKKPPMTFWIGARTYGYKTRETLTAGTTLASGSDMQEIHLDDFYRKDEKNYKVYAKRLIAKRLEKIYKKQSNMDYIATYDQFESKFQLFNETVLIDKLKNNKKILAHVSNLKEHLKQKTDKSEIIIQNLLYKTENPLHEKYNFLLFYKKWYQNRNKKDIDFVNISENVKDSFVKYLSKEKSDHTNLVSKFKKDLLSQLAIENGIKNYEYVGLDNFIDLSNSNTRSLVLLLKNTIENSNIRGEKPLSENGFISLDAQYMAAYKVAEWFYNEAEIFGDDLKVFYKNIRRLTDYLKLYRTTDNLTETSVLGFSFKKKEISAEIDKNLTCLQEYSILVKSNNTRKDKSGLGIGEPQYSLNPVLSPLWNLPTNVRGTPTFSNKTMDYIFNDKVKEEDYRKFYKSRKDALNAPFGPLKTPIIDIHLEVEPNLFNQDD